MTTDNLIQFCKWRRQHDVLLNLELYKAFELVKWVSSSQILSQSQNSSATSETITIQIADDTIEIFLQELVNVS